MAGREFLQHPARNHGGSCKNYCGSFRRRGALLSKQSHQLTVGASDAPPLLRPRFESSGKKWDLEHNLPMIGENRQLVTVEPVEFEK